MQLISVQLKTLLDVFSVVQLEILELYIVFKDIMIQIAFQMICGIWFGE